MISRRPCWCTKTKEWRPILVHKANSLRIELYFYENTFFCFIEPIMAAGHVSENDL